MKHCCFFLNLTFVSVSHQSIFSPFSLKRMKKLYLLAYLYYHNWPLQNQIHDLSRDQPMKSKLLYWGVLVCRDQRTNHLTIDMEESFDFRTGYNKHLVLIHSQHFSSQAFLLLFQNWYLLFLPETSEVQSKNIELYILHWSHIKT